MIPTRSRLVERLNLKPQKRMDARTGTILAVIGAVCLALVFPWLILLYLIAWGVYLIVRE